VASLEASDETLQLRQLFLGEVGFLREVGDEWRDRATERLLDKAADLRPEQLDRRRPGEVAIETVDLSATEMPLVTQPFHHREHGRAGQSARRAERVGHLADRRAPGLGHVLEQREFLVPDAASHEPSVTTSVVNNITVTTSVVKQRREPAAGSSVRPTC
jgi:hypothetical protein